jgi:hypothetical protein
VADRVPDADAVVLVDGCDRGADCFTVGHAQHRRTHALPERCAFRQPDVPSVGTADADADGDAVGTTDAAADT